MKDKIISQFNVPKEMESFIDKMLLIDEQKLISKMEDKMYSKNELKQLVSELIDIDSENFIASCYKRCILNKVIEENEVLYVLSDSYQRLGVFAQFEQDIWEGIDDDIRKSVDEWYVNEYAKKSIEKMEKGNDRERSNIENAYFISLEEALDLIDKKESSIYLLPCNCKTMAKNCNKPQNVCIQFETGINSMIDRGWGVKISKDEAKESIRNANKSGLMHSSECESALCNCDACCCYPIRASKILGMEKQWPKKIHEISWNKEKCISCGKCSKICNFGAFTIENKVVSFNNEKCWGCTICKDNCPTNAIKLKF